MYIYIYFSKKLTCIHICKHPNVKIHKIVIRSLCYQEYKSN